VLLEPEPGGTAEPAEAAAQLRIDTNVDDLDPRLWPAVLRALLAAGAVDAWLTPILMKKGRPAHTLSVLVSHQNATAVRRVVFTETSAIGLREHLVGKRVLERAWVSVSVSGAPVRIKTASLDGVVVNAQPEYDDVAELAERTHRPVKSVLADAVAAAHAAGLLT
jgi:pyridinium-3,5-bisthiocarboxylic acid mononucleotide nickel chelatase